MRMKNLKIERTINHPRKWRWTAYIGPLVAATGYADTLSEATKRASEGG